MDMFYFADIYTNKCVKIFDSDFNLKATIPLDNVPNRVDIRCLQVIAQDSIIMLNLKDNNIYLCDFNGTITNSNVVFIEDSMEFDTPSSDVTGIYKSKMYLKYCINRSQLFSNPSYFTNDELIKHTDSVILDYPYMTSIDLFSNDTINVINKLFYNVYKENFSYGYAIDDYPHYHIANGKLFMPIGHNGKLYIADLDTEKIERIIQIKSKYTKIGFDMEDFKYSPTNYLNSKFEQFKYFSYNAGGVKSVVWDRYRKLYYFYVQHYSKEMYAAKEFSIQIFDESFNKKGEVTLDNHKYYSSMFVCPKGLLINSNRIESKDYDKNIQKYTLFTISD
jgi:hypothetical protein